MTLYVTDECGSCRTAEKAIAQWWGTGELSQEVEVQPLPTDPNFESYVRLHNQGQFGVPVLVDPLRNIVVIGFAPRRYRELLCQPA